MIVINIIQVGHAYTMVIYTMGEFGGGFILGGSCLAKQYDNDIVLTFSLI